MTEAENIDTMNDFLNGKLKDFEKKPSGKNLKRIQSELNKEDQAPITFWLETTGLVILIALTLYWMSTVFHK